jgi:cell division protein FtsB
LKTRFLIGLVLLGAAGYFAVFGGEYDLFELRRVRGEQAVERERLDSARAEFERLRVRADSLERDSASLERLARERYGMIRPGERLYRFTPRASSDSATVDVNGADGGSIRRPPD